MRNYAKLLNILYCEEEKEMQRAICPAHQDIDCQTATLRWGCGKNDSNCVVETWLEEQAALGFDTLGLSRHGGYLYATRLDDIPADAIDSYLPLTADNIAEALADGYYL